MERIDATSLAHGRSLLDTNSAAACEYSNVCHSITNWRLALVRWQDPARLPLTELVGVLAEGNK
jgi:hypothetical protein